jgi:hypothetical protein
MAYFELPLHVNLHACEYTIKKVLGTEEYYRYVAQLKPYLSAANRAKQLLSVESYTDYDVEDWHRIF